MKKSNGRYGIDRFNQQLLDRIDNMDDASEFSPYQPSKKTIIQDSEMFDTENYFDEDQESGDNEYEMSGEQQKKGSSGIIIGLLIAVIFIVGAFVLIMALKGALTA